MTNHPISPSPELVRQWLDNDDFPFVTGTNELLSITKDRLNSVIAQAAKWGADHELEACCEAVSQVLGIYHFVAEDDLLREVRATRRPKSRIRRAQERLQELDK